MKHSFEEKVELSILANSLLEPGSTVIVALSGGADSVALLASLTALGYRCVVAHCDYHLRGDESERDRRHAMAMAEMCGATYIEKHYDATGYSQERGISVEMGCRELRYKWFAELSAKYGDAPIAVGHHRDDKVETMWLNLLRGTGLTGVAAMHPRNGLIVRPMLDVDRREVLAYLADKGLTYVTDSTNLMNDFKRNRLRNVLLPAVRAYFPDAQTTMLRSARNLSDNLALYNELVARTLAPYRQGSDTIDLSALRADITNSAMLLFEGIRHYGFKLEQCESMLADALGARRFISSEYVATVHRGTLTLRSRCTPAEGKEEIYYLSLDDSTTWPEGFELERIAPDEVVYDRTGLTIYLDADRLVDKRLIMRRWHNGDKIAPFGMKGMRLVSDLFSDAHYSPEQKASTWLLIANGLILWVTGLRTSRHMPITSVTTQVLKITYTPLTD